jgi:hypothetical protein
MLSVARAPTAADPRRALFCRQPFCRDLQGLLPSSSSSYDDDAEDDRAGSMTPVSAPETSSNFRGGACASWNYGTPSPPSFRQGVQRLPASMPLDITFHRPFSFPAETVNKRRCAIQSEAPWNKRRRMHA